MALTVPQLEAHFGRMLRTLSVLFTAEHLAPQLELIAPGLFKAGKKYVTDGALGTQADRLEAMTALAKGIYVIITGGNPDGADAHHFSAHWLAERQ